MQTAGTSATIHLMSTGRSSGELPGCLGAAAPTDKHNTEQKPRNDSPSSALETLPRVHAPCAPPPPSRARLPRRRSPPLRCGTRGGCWRGGTPPCSSTSWSSADSSRSGISEVVHRRRQPRLLRRRGQWRSARRVAPETDLVLVHGMGGRADNLDLGERVREACRFVVLQLYGGHLC